jgi:hypothetical protein
MWEDRRRTHRRRTLLAFRVRAKVTGSEAMLSGVVSIG